MAMLSKSWKLLIVIKLKLAVLLTVKDTVAMDIYEEIHFSSIEGMSSKKLNCDTHSILLDSPF